MVNGPESFTIDNQYILGEAPELDNLYVCGGMNSSGIASAGGAGFALAEWITAGGPTMDMWAVDLRRFGPQQANLNFLAERTKETLGLHY
jgi:4-methylaminobutanoate oxidase (formaldehyde-forming)